MSAFEKLLESQLQELKKQGRYRYFLDVNKSAQHFPDFYYRDEQGHQHKAVNWCSNDYLAQSTREEVIAKLSFVAHKSGTGSGGTRNISGTTIHHKELEKTIAHWHNKEAALLFPGAFAANVATLQTLGRNISDLVFISDERNHASLIEGIRSAGNSKFIFRHNDVDHLGDILKTIPLHQPKLIVFESVYSMSGNVAPIEEIVKLAKQYNAQTYIDEVHAVGLYGNSGAGLLEQLNLSTEVDIINGTLSKAIGVFGGYVSASKVTIDFIRSFAGGFIFTTSIPPAICSAAEKSIQLLQKEKSIRDSFFENVKLLRSELDKFRIPYKDNQTHITIIPIGDSRRCRFVADELLKLGVYIQPINSPTVPVGEECLRIIITTRHQLSHIQYLAECLNQVLNGNHHTHRPKFEAFTNPN